MGTRTGPVWEFTVGARSAASDTSSGTVLDVNGDGYADHVVGAPGANVSGMMSVGRVHVYMGSASGLNSISALSLTGPDGAGGEFGTSVASAGDVNGDGFADLVVGAPYAESGGMSDRGGVHVYLGSAAGLSSVPALSLTGPDGEGGQFGTSVASAGDVNGDGFADLIVGAPYAISGTGRVYLYMGSASGALSSRPAFSLTGPDGEGGQFGTSVASAGYVNGDGFADLVVGAPYAMSGTGRVYLYMGSAAGLKGMITLSLTGPGDTYSRFGYSVASASDVNGDGFADLIVGAPYADSRGRVHVYMGSAAGLSSVPVLSLTGPDGMGGSFGRSIASAGDVNGGGFADRLVNAPRIARHRLRSSWDQGSASM